MINFHFKAQPIDYMVKHCKNIDHLQYQVVMGEDSVKIYCGEYPPVYSSSWEDLVRKVVHSERDIEKLLDYAANHIPYAVIISGSASMGGNTELLSIDQAKERIKEELVLRSI